MLFDARAAKQLTDGAHIILEEYPGLRLVAGKHSRSWIYRYKSDTGLMRQTVLGRWPAMSLIAAASEWEKLRGARGAGADPATQKRAQRAAARPTPVAKGYTVQALWDDYIKGHIVPHRKPKGAAEVQRLFVRHGGPIADQQAASVKRSDAFALLEGMTEIPVLAGQLRQELAGAWDYALDAGRLPDETPNWWRQIMRGRLRSKGKRIAGERIGVVKRSLSDDEAGELIRWLPNFSKSLHDALTMYLWTGTRGSEIMSIERSEISEELDGLWWTIPKSKTKNARHALATDLRVPLVGRAELLVRRRMAVHERYLFPARLAGQSMPQKAVQTTVYYHQPYSATNPESIRPRLTVSHWAPHDLRRTVRTMLAALGCPHDVAESVLGHMQPSVYNRHQYDRERREWITKLSAHLERCAASMQPGD
ncbi:MAG: tyrosine-type recombinase/integrase [Xanthomonadaceae bacterium]|nr:tyrosine-type recombinase/integrase [Xanthomonadaceae bacterium]MBH2008101.1 tyrosine-type recombinase/integrase [Xanthomonadaceae bacterium]